MENRVRSERTRNAVIQAALAVIARDGAGRLTLDAIAKESGISKGGVMHQFRNKEAVFQALLEHQIERFEQFSRDYMARHAAGHVYPKLAAQLATLREVVFAQGPEAFAILGAIAQEPKLLPVMRRTDASVADAIKEEAENPEIAMLRWLAARGLVLTSLFGFCPLTGKERDRLFGLLMDDGLWSAFAKTPAPARKKAARTKNKKQK